MTEDEAGQIVSATHEVLSKIFSRDLKITIICRHPKQNDRRIIASDDNNYDVQELLSGLNGGFK